MDEMKKVIERKNATETENVVLEVTEQDYEQGLGRGWTEDDMLKPGRYSLRRGGFRERHTRTPEERKRA